MIAAVLAVGAQPSGAVTTTKSFNATCTGADAPTTNTLAALGGALAAPVTVKVDGPQFVEPGQTGVPFSINMSLALDAKTVDTVAAISPSLKVSNVKAPLAVSGPTATTAINASIPDQTLTLTAGKPFTAAFPAIKGQLDDIGNSGLIKITTSSLTFSITLTKGPLTDPLNLKCSTGSTLASIPVKVAGSPDIVQPIEVDAVEGQPVTVDVLGEHVTNGKTKDGVEQQVDPSTLKIVDGDAQIVNGQVVATGPAAGTTADVTFEVCAGTIKISDADPGTSEVQEVRLFHDPDSQALKREIGSRFAFDGESADKVVWSVDGILELPDLPKDEVLEEARIPHGRNGWPTTPLASSSPPCVPHRLRGAGRPGVDPDHRCRKRQGHSGRARQQRGGQRSRGRDAQGLHGLHALHRGVHGRPGQQGARPDLGCQPVFLPPL
ncbi:MAG: hypothetical protein R2789_00765 [Microthrixaceae bacterium]